MSHKPYSAYTVEELSLDDLFVRWVQHPDDDEVEAYWQNWLSQNPDCSETVDMARRLIKEGSQPRLPALSTDEISSVWGRIRESLQTMEDLRPLQPDVRAVIGWWYFIRTVAALMGVMLLIGWALWMQYGPNQCVSTISTPANQTRLIRLPDNSTMTLQPNSSVRYARQWTDETPRAVWLNGEADFSVTHRNDTSSARLFRVHMADCTIEAIGTIFRVRQRPQGTYVALTSGNVNLLLKQQQPIRLQPGDSIEIAAGLAKSLP
ncbi:iron dicitrate transport regulator FecR [Spirosoma sp. HMF3257]|uniref:Iron dicitrate transport regulator FecR n=1 Tax=Spirosoma telluris TaxID=2183553 RepID=A0A327NT02_9BACT|nr:iron dicitrate transport regulator FecR [Spirosoma telluris]RAI78447.1 iron dicitrate transport regulator FecR [Spirosoma telluris]